MRRPAAEAVAALRRTALETLRPHLAGVRRAALLEYPEYPNPGDAAIWLGTLAALEQLGHPPPVYASEARAHDAEAMDRALGADGVVLLQGGGSFGDLWPGMQGFREAVIGACGGRRVLQLPQTLHFDDPGRIAGTRRVLASHGDVTLFVRDRASLQLAGDLGASGALLCPDLALCLDLPPPRRRPEAPILWLARDDREAAPGAAAPRDAPDVVVRDWIDPPRTRAYRRLSRRSRRLRESARASSGARRRLMATYAPAGWDRVAYACSVLEAGRVVVTDRLHGHVLCLLAGRPHVLLDNVYGKVRGFFETWTADVEGIRFAGDAEEALALARDLARRAPGA